MPTLADLAVLMAVPPENGNPGKWARAGKLEFAILGEYPFETALIATIIYQWNMIEHGFFGILARLIEE